MILLHAERLSVGEVQDHPDDSGHKTEHQTPKRTLHKIVNKNVKRNCNNSIKTTMLKKCWKNNVNQNIKYNVKTAELSWKDHLQLVADIKYFTFIYTIVINGV